MGIKGIVKKAMELGEMGFNKEGGAINWFPGHMAAATRAIRNRLKLSDLVIEVRDARVCTRYIHYIPFSSAHQDLQPQLSAKRRIVALNKKDLANSNVLNKWVRYFDSCKQDCLPINAHNRSSIRKIAHQPSIYVLDTPGVLVPSIPNVETGLKLALAGSVKDSVVGEDRIVQYLLAVLNTRGTPLHWKQVANQREEITQISEDKPDYNPKDLRANRKRALNASDLLYVKDLVKEVQHALYITLSEFDGNMEDENELECLIEHQFEVLQRALKIPHKSSEARLMVSKKFLTLFRAGKLGSFVLDDVPE
ncbi:short integuments 2, mitochondrial isoform X3 [Durio zibethinus]|uniref:Short integuments 2, mitochondrial isoform X3 n=1 Tax=Durio zibethinus TaxID=66656 RepID=A0A6P5YYR8_DURZI|nr:short integuments 2, mitochondrial isoform X3 [Durio zibethinus]